MVKKKPAPQTRTPQSFKLFVGLMVVLVGLVLFRGISSHGISRFPVHRAKQPQSATSATAQSTDQAKVLGQETKVNPPTQEVAASHAASIFSSGKYANLRLENFGKPDYIVAQDNGKGVFYLQPGGNVFSEGSFNFADGVVRGGLRVEGDATLVNNLSIGGDTFKVEPTKGQVTVKGDFQVDGNRTIRGTGSLTINPTGNLYLQSESFLIDENGNLVVANVNAPELEYSGDITLRAKADKTTAVTITNPNDNYLANLSVEGDIAVNGGKVTLASGETIDAESADTLKLTSDGNVAVVLGDSAGQKKLVVYDAIGSSQVFAVDSDGNVSATGGATISGNVSMSGTLTADNTQVANFTSTGITALGDSVSDTLSIPAGLSTNFVPATASTYNLGSASKPFANVYADNLVASSSDVSGTKQETFTLDTDNTGGNLTLEFGATNNEQLLWDATNSRFRFTDDLLVDDGLTVNGNAIFSALTPGSIPFIGTGGVLTQNNSQLFWDRNNNKLGIGTSAPDADVDIRKPGGGIQWVANSNGNTNLTNGATLGSYEFAGYFNGSVNDVARIRGFYTGDGTTRSGAIGFFTHNLGSTSEKLRITSTGNVGIGTTNPSAILHVADSISNNWRFNTSGTLTTQRALAYYFSSESNPRWSIGANVLGNGLAGIGFGPGDTSTIETSGAAVGYPASRSLGLYTSNATALTERVRIDSNGNVGIGTSPTSLLHVLPSGTVSNSLLTVRGTTTTTSGGVDLSPTISTATTSYGVYAEPIFSPTSNIASANGTLILGRAQNSSSNITTLRGLYTGVRTSANYSGTLSGAQGIFIETPTFLGSAPTTNYGLYIDSQTGGGTNYALYSAGGQTYFAGNVGIGTTSPSSQLELGVGQIAVPLGSVSNPSYSFTGDLNTGIFSPAADNLILAAGGATTLQITSGAAYIRAGGAANGPTLSFIGDTDMGLWRANTDTLAISTAGNERMRIDSSGNVGIGTTSPNYKLSISQPVSASTYKAAISIEDTLTQADSSTGIDWRNTQYSWNQGRIAVIRNGANANFSMAFSTAVNGVLTEGLRLLSTGNVGIGTTTPALRLNVTATGSGGYPTTSGTNQTGIQRLEAIGTDNILDMGVAGASPWGSWLQSTNRYNLAIVYPLLLNPNGGNVGIGTTAPSVPLEVQRNISGTSENVLARFRLENTSNTAADKYLEIFSDNTEGAAIVGLNTYRQGGSASRFEIRNENTTALSITSSSFVGIGTISPGEKLEVNGGVRLNTVTAKPTCDSSHRGTFWSTQGSAGVKDNVEVCAKDAADAYAWRTIY